MRGCPALSSHPCACDPSLDRWGCPHSNAGSEGARGPSQTRQMETWGFVWDGCVPLFLRPRPTWRVQASTRNLLGVTEVTRRRPSPAVEKPHPQDTRFPNAPDAHGFQVLESIPVSSLSLSLSTLSELKFYHVQTKRSS